MVAQKSVVTASVLRTKCPKAKEDLSQILKEVDEDARDLCESLQAAPDFQTQIDVLHKWNSPEIGVYFQSLASLFFSLPLKSSLRRSISCKIRHTHERDLLTSCFLHAIKAYEGTALVQNVIKCFDDNNSLLMDLAKHLPIQFFLETLTNCLKAKEEEQQLSDALRALAYARNGASKSLLDAYSSFSGLCHRIIQSSALSMDTKGKAAKILISEEILRNSEEKYLLDILKMMEDRSSLYFCPNMENKLIYLNGIVTSTSSFLVIKQILGEYIQISSQNDLDTTSVIILSRGILRCTSVLLTEPESLYDIDINILENYIWNYLEYPTSSVRYNVKDTLKEYIKIKYASNSLDNMVVKVLSWDNFDKRKYAALIPLIRTGGIEVISLVLKTEPTFQDKLIDNFSDSSLRSSCADLYKICLSQIKDTECWTWLKPIVDGYKVDTSNVCRRNQLDVIFKEAIKRSDPSIANILINNILHSEEEKNAFSLCMVLQSLKIMKMLKGSQFQFDNYDFILECLTDFNDDVRLEALDFLCSSLKTSEIIVEKELSLILEYGIKGNMLLFDPPTQMHFLAIMKKFIGRINEGFGLSKRRNDEAITSKYISTLKDMKKWIIADNLSKPKVHLYFRVIGFEILLMSVELLHDKTELFTLTSEEGKILVECLKTETHDKNCEVIIEILSKSFGGKGDDIVDFSIESILDLVRTPKPRNGSIAQYLTKVLRICDVKSDFEKSLLDEFMRQLVIARQSLVRASFEAPLYGILGCLKNGPYVDSIMTECHELWTLVSPIVNAASPEGYSQESDDQLDCDPQLLLLLAWRTTKEVCDIFETTNEDILGTSKFFIQVFSEAMHRGAFERAYSGFCTISKRLWTHQDEKIRQYPGKLLQDTLHCIYCVSKDTTVTRRSAGFPFLIQALLSSQPGMSSFDGTMESLLNWLLSKSSNTSVKVHASNILRAIFRDSSLGDKVMKFISKGMKAAILGFESDAWPIRNASTLLFSSLITRVFGVKRDQDDLSKSNCVYTFKLFFERFPELNDFLLQQLEDKHSQTYNCTTVFPSLLILAKLKTMSSPPSTKVASELQNFHDRIIIFLSHPVLKIRNLASYALNALSSEKTVPALANVLIEYLPVYRDSSNALHGILSTLNLLAVKNPQIHNTILPNLQDKLSTIAIRSPIILIEKLKLLGSSFYVSKDTLKQELTHNETASFPHPGKDLYQRLLMEKALQKTLDSKDEDLVQFLIGHNHSLYFETLNAQHKIFETFALNFIQGNETQRVISITGSNEFVCFLKVYVSSDVMDCASEPIWNKMCLFLEPSEDNFQQSGGLFSNLYIEAMTKYVNLANPSHDKLKKWTSYLKDCMLNQESNDCKRIIINSISKSVSYLKPIEDPEKAIISFRLWFVLLSLSLDGDRLIQKYIHDILVKLWGSSRMVLPDQVHVELADWLIRNSLLYIAETKYVLLQAFEEIRERSCGNEDSEDETSSLAFEKGNELIRYDDIDIIQKKIREHYGNLQCDKEYKLDGFISKL